MGDAAVEPVIALLGDVNAHVRFHAAHALSKLADARAVDALLVALGDSDPTVVQKATYALGSIGDVRALPALVARLGATEGESRNKAAIAKVADDVHPHVRYLASRLKKG